MLSIQRWSEVKTVNTEQPLINVSPFFLKQSLKGDISLGMLSNRVLNNQTHTKGDKTSQRIFFQGLHLTYLSQHKKSVDPPRLFSQIADMKIDAIG